MPNMEVSIEDEEKLGEIINDMVFQDMEELNSPYLDSAIFEITNRLENNLESTPYEFTFHVIKNDQVNAFATLGGHIFINKKELSKYAALDLAKVMSLVLTEQITSKNLSILELVALGRQPYTNWIGSISKKDITIVNKALNQTNIQNLKYKKCFELSDGQLQKVMISRALAQDTDLIILDEPTTHLDMYHKAYILKLLQKLAKETNKTILFSSHEIDLAIQLCDNLIVMTDNNVVSDEPCKLIKNGVFESLFPKDLIAFDEKAGSFRVKK